MGRGAGPGTLRLLACLRVADSVGHGRGSAGPLAISRNYARSSESGKCVGMDLVGLRADLTIHFWAPVIMLWVTIGRARDSIRDWITSHGARDPFRLKAAASQRRPILRAILIAQQCSL